MSPDLHATFRQALSQHLSGNAAEARALYRSMAAQAPERSSALNALALLEGDEGNLTAARRLAAWSRHAAPDGIASDSELDAVARRVFDKAYDLHRNGQALKAARAFAALAAARAGWDVAARNAAAIAHAVLEAAVQKHKAGRGNEAKADYAAILEIDPGHFDAKHLLGLAEKQSGNLLAALRLLGEVARSSAYSEPVHINLSNTIEMALSTAGGLAAGGQAEAADDLYRAIVAAVSGFQDPSHILAGGFYRIDAAAPLAKQAEAVYANIHGHILKDDLLAYLPEDAVIVDCGANDGRDSVDLATLFPRGAVYAFEPLDPIYDQLLANAAGMPNVHPVKLALADENGERTFFVSLPPYTGSSSLLPPDGNVAAFGQSIVVQTMTLDHWAERAGVARVDMLWLDMQGFELQAMRAAPRIMETVRVVYTEASRTGERYKDACLYPELRSWLEAQGFAVKAEQLPWGGVGGNVLFVRA